MQRKGCSGKKGFLEHLPQPEIVYFGGMKPSKRHTDSSSETSKKAKRGIFFPIRMHHHVSFIFSIPLTTFALFSLAS